MGEEVVRVPDADLDCMCRQCVHARATATAEEFAALVRRDS